MAFVFKKPKDSLLFPFFFSPMSIASFEDAPFNWPLRMCPFNWLHIFFAAMIILTLPSSSNTSTCLQNKQKLYTKQKRTAPRILLFALSITHVIMFSTGECNLSDVLFLNSRKTSKQSTIRIHIYWFVDSHCKPRANNK